jgi:predicted flavoprotein YhiN
LFQETDIEEYEIDTRCDFLIVGAGAAGLAAAVSYARSCDGRVIAFDVNDKAGKKIAATGNGRCNLSNTAAEGYTRTRTFFESLGLKFSFEEDGRVYPMNREAACVRRALITEAERLGVILIPSAHVTEVRIRDEESGRGFVVLVQVGGSDAVDFFAERVLIATGGKCTPQLGNLGDGFAFARRLGHHVKRILPALVPMVYGPEEVKIFAALNGVRARARVSLLHEGITLAEEIGQVQFAGSGISGICVFNLSRCMRTKRDTRQGRGFASYNERHGFEVSMDFAPGLSFDEVAALLSEKRVAGMNGLINSGLADQFNFLIDAGLDEQYATGDRDRRFLTFAPIFDERYTYADGDPGDRARREATLIKGFTVPIRGTKGWKAAQVTSGGVSLDETHPGTFESRLWPGLYFAGEVLDYDGPSGGYNLDWAWNSGIGAGEAAARKTRER